MRSPQQRPLIDWTGRENEEYFRLNLGGQAMWNHITNPEGKIKLPKDTLLPLVQSTIDNGEAADFAGGQEAIDALPPSMREGMLMLSALRHIINQLDPTHAGSGTPFMPMPGAADDYRRGMEWADD
jgi:hypothetical protein